jgi:large subunit ribosomal protein L10
MPLNKEQKQAIIAEVAEVAGKAHSLIAAENLGLTVEAVTRLRVAARKSKVYLRVVKNTLARRALQGTAFSSLDADLKGPLMLAFAIEEPGSAARVVKDFTKINDKLNVKLVVLQGKRLATSDLDAVANLPTRDQALSILMATMKAPVQKLARTLAAVRDQKQDQAVS